MAQKDWKILFIDDEEGIRKVTSIALEDVGYEVITAPDGERGLQLCEEASPSDRHYRYPHAGHGRHGGTQKGQGE